MDAAVIRAVLAEAAAESLAQAGAADHALHAEAPGGADLVDDAFLAFGAGAVAHVLPATHGAGAERGVVFAGLVGGLSAGKQRSQIVLIDAVVSSGSAAGAQAPLLNPL